MVAFAIAAGIVAVVHIVATFQRSRPAVIVSGILWLLYAYYELQVATGVLCDKNCNIRVDLVFFLPVLGLATLCAYRSFLGKPGQFLVLARIIGVVACLVLALVVESPVLSSAACMAALGIGVYPVVRRQWWPTGRGA